MAPRSLRSTSSSQCAACTACKRHCPDIDQENAYWKDVASGSRRLASYAFPGLVLAFYCYYWLRHGDWEAYFDGRWTRHDVDAALVMGEGFFFAPAVPALVAATPTLVAFSAVSYALFRLLQHGIGGLTGSPERSRHLGLALAAFAAFNLIYVFAGAPSLRRLPGATRLAAFAAPLVGTFFLVRRWQRAPEHFIGERGAVRLLRSWPFEEAPPRDPGEVYGWIRASRHAPEKNVAAYAATVREMIADGLVRRGELRLLDGVRKQLGISEAEHDEILARLSEEERHLFEESAAGGVERAGRIRRPPDRPGGIRQWLSRGPHLRCPVRKGRRGAKAPLTTAAAHRSGNPQGGPRIPHRSQPTPTQNDRPGPGKPISVS